MKVLVAYEPYIGRGRFTELVAEQLDAALFWREDLENPSVVSELTYLVVMPHKVASAERETLEVDVSLLTKMPALRAVITASTGYDHVDTELCRVRKVALYNVSGYATDSVAELCVGMTLSLFRRLSALQRNVCKGRWDEGFEPGKEIAGKTVGILGTGEIGLRTAAIFRAFRCNVLGWSRTPKSEFLALGGSYVSEVLELAERCDVVSLHLPQTRQTNHIVRREFFDRMQPDSLLVNVSRAGLVEPFSLIAALKSNQIGGAALDVLDVEPMVKSHELASLETVLVTPHIGFKTKEALERLDRAVVEKIRMDIDGSAQSRVV